VQIDTNQPGTFGFLPKESKTQHMVCARCEEYIPKLAKSKEECRICKTGKRAVGIAWNVWKQVDTFWCLDCFLESCKTLEEKNKLRHIFGQS